MCRQDLKADYLLQRLTQEWTKPDENALEPVIIEAAEERYFGSTHLYVIWSDWGTRSQQERSELIMKAYKATHDAEAFLNVTVAMGLTPEEAQRMGIHYTLEKTTA